MLLTLNTVFEGYTPVKVLRKSTSYREVYLAKNDSGADVVLTVYDMNRLPECFADKKIPEFEIIPQLTNDAFPAYMEQGHYKSGRKKSLCWMATKYAGHTTLTDYILSDHVRNEREMLLQYYNLLVAVKELSWRMGGGSHNNITTDNIIVSDNGDGEVKWHLRGLNCVSQSCRGRATFDTSAQSHSFMAPETLIAYYNIKADIFSLGIVLAFVLQGKHPWKECIGSDHILTAAMVKQMRAHTPVLDMPDPLKNIVTKAIAIKPSERYKSIEEFGAAIAKYLGDENLSSFECFAPAFSKPVATPPKTNAQVEESVDIIKQSTPPQPKSSVKIERVKGNGFKDVAGMAQLKNKLTRNFVDIVQNRELAAQFQITPPNGILLWGPPGTGKTFISRKLAEESGLLFSLVRPSDLGNIYIHGSQSMIADLFTRGEELAAKNHCGVLLVFDEFDSLVPKRGMDSDSNQANEVAEFLTRLDGCADKNIFVVATTNRIEAIDPAIIRKGRMDEVIYVGLPDEEARKELLEIELLKRPHEDIDTAHIVELTKGYSSSDISFIVKECARCSFEESVKAKHIVKINQTQLEKTIAETRPSVTAEELREYECAEKSFSRGQKTERPRIGFVK